MKLQTLIEGLQFVQQNYGDDVRIIVRMNDKAEGLSDSEGFHSDIGELHMSLKARCFLFH